MYNSPLISIIVPNYNHAPYLEKRIESILSQTFQDFELILLDDCSTDSSVAIIKEYKTHDKVSHVFLSKSNSGSPFGLWEYGITKARGKYIWIAESDDWARDSFLKEVIAILENSEAVLVHTDSSFYINNEFKRNDWWDSFNSDNWNSNYVTEGREILKQYGRFKCPVINVSSAVFRKDIIKNNFYPIDYKYCGDWKFWVDIFMTGSVGFVAKPLNIVRVHHLSATSNRNVFYSNKLKENVRVINNTNEILKCKTKYSINYRWLIDQWLFLFEYQGNYFAKENHSLNLPLRFKIVFYKSFLKLIFKKGFIKIMKKVYDS